MQLAHLRLQGAVLRRRHHFLASCRGGQCALVHQPAPGEDLAADDAMLTGNERHAQASADTSPRRSGPYLPVSTAFGAAHWKGTRCHCDAWSYRQSSASLYIQERDPVRSFRGRLNLGAVSKGMLPLPLHQHAFWFTLDRINLLFFDGLGGSPGLIWGLRSCSREQACFSRPV